MRKTRQVYSSVEIKFRDVTGGISRTTVRISSFKREPHIVWKVLRYLIWGNSLDRDRGLIRRA